MKLSTMLFALVLVVASALALKYPLNSNGSVSSDPAAATHYLQSRYADHITSGSTDPWPLWDNGGVKRRKIKACFADEETRNTFLCKVGEAMKLWMDALGGEASAETGHSLKFTEAGKPPQGAHHLCFLTFDKNVPLRNNPWNPQVRPDTLVIYPGPHYLGTIGYVSYKKNATPMRHSLMVGEDGPGAVSSIAHELGHVLGMAHEHQRQDRDNYVEFRPQNVDAYAAALSSAFQEGVTEDIAKWYFANDQAFSEKHHFPIDFIKGDGENHPIDGDSGFDYESIMLYPSYTFAASEQGCLADLDHCPLARVTTEHGVRIGSPQRIYPNLKPSAGDVEFVKKYYPWAG